MPISKEKSAQIVDQIYKHMDKISVHGGIAPEIAGRETQRFPGGRDDSLFSYSFHYKGKQFVIKALPKMFRLINGASFELFLIEQSGATSHDAEQLYPPIPETVWDGARYDSHIDGKLEKIYEHVRKEKENLVDRKLGENFFDEE
ncbi:MAG: hypothetical protein AB7F86_01375 [Bdellovibrionales bacterium]